MHALNIPIVELITMLAYYVPLVDALKVVEIEESLAVRASNVQGCEPWMAGKVTKNVIDLKSYLYPREH